MEAMKIHPRNIKVRDAESKLREALGNIEKEFELTQFEYMQMLHGVYSSDISGCLKFLIREERHGDRHKPGDLA
jgi:hypothetical protein